MDSVGSDLMTNFTTLSRETQRMNKDLRASWPPICRPRIEFVLALGLLLSSFVSQFCYANDVRRWTDASGDYNIEASFVDVESGSVQLLKGDGTNIAVPFKLLSSSDQKYVRSRLRQRHTQHRKKSLPVTDLRTGDVDATTADATPLYGINWYPAERVSTVAGGKNIKPVMWFRVLGSLDGFM